MVRIEKDIEFLYTIHKKLSIEYPNLSINEDDFFLYCDTGILNFDVANEYKLRSSLFYQFLKEIFCSFDKKVAITGLVSFFQIIIFSKIHKKLSGTEINNDYFILTSLDANKNKITFDINITNNIKKFLLLLSSTNIIQNNFDSKYKKIFNELNSDFYFNVFNMTNLYLLSLQTNQYHHINYLFQGNSNLITYNTDQSSDCLLSIKFNDISLLVINKSYKKHRSKDLKGIVIYDINLFTINYNKYKIDQLNSSVNKKDVYRNLFDISFNQDNKIRFNSRIKMQFLCVILFITIALLLFKNISDELKKTRFKQSIYF